MQLTPRRLGETFMTLYATIGVFLPIIILLTRDTIHPFFFTSIATFLASLFFGGLMALRGTWRQLTIRAAWLPLAMTTLCIVILLHPLMNIAVSHTTAGNAAAIFLIEILYSFLFFGVILRKERYDRMALLGVFLMLLGAGAIIYVPHSSIHTGDLFLAAILFLAPIGNYFQQQARTLVSTETLLFVRSAAGSIIATAIGSQLFPFPSPSAILSAAPYLLAAALLFFIIQRILWVESIHRIPVAHANAFFTLTPLLTLPIAYIIFGDIPSVQQLLGIAPLIIGTLILLRHGFLKTTTAPA